jgi:poly(hydroxyalkanoate) depolymerase family esterase
MSDRARFGMREAARLTRAGRLSEATEMLQRMVQGGAEPHPAAANRAAAPTIDLVPEAVEVTDPGPSWANGVVRAHLPEALRRVLDRITPTRVAPRPAEAPEPPPPGSPEITDGGQFLASSYRNQAGSRAYKLYVPSRYRGQPLPLIVMLHGCTQSPDDFAAGTRMNLHADEHNCFIAYPEQSASANASKCWNWFRRSDQIRGQGEPSLISGITRQVISDYSVDEQRVYAAGLSAGAAEAAILAATYPDLYAAIGVHSGLACGAASDVASAFAAMRRSKPAGSIRSQSGEKGYSRTVPAIVFHGDQDATVHPHNGNQVIAQLQEGLHADLRMMIEHGRAAGGRAYTRTIYRDPSGDAMFELWITHGAGHTWSGGSPAGSYTDPQGPDATREMLRFFLEHPMNS